MRAEDADLLQEGAWGKTEVGRRQMFHCPAPAGKVTPALPAACPAAE